MRIQFCRNYGENIVAEFEVAEMPTKEQCEAIENEIYEEMGKWDLEHGDFDEFYFWQCCYDAVIKHINIIPNPVVKTFFI